MEAPKATSAQSSDSKTSANEATEKPLLVQAAEVVALARCS